MTWSSLHLIRTVWARVTSQVDALRWQKYQICMRIVKVFFFYSVLSNGLFWYSNTIWLNLFDSICIIHKYTKASIVYIWFGLTTCLWNSLDPNQILWSHLKDQHVCRKFQSNCFAQFWGKLQMTSLSKVLVPKTQCDT